MSEVTFPSLPPTLGCPKCWSGSRPARISVTIGMREGVFLRAHTPGRVFQETVGAADGANAATVASVTETSARHSAVEAREGAMTTRARA